MPNATVAIVPLRAPGVGKTRLSPLLDAGQRAELAGAMLHDVVAALRGGSAIDRIVVAAGGEGAMAAADALGVEAVADEQSLPAPGLDAVLAATVRRTVRPHEDVVVVPADLPRLTVHDVDALLAVDADVGVAPTAGGGTGGLLVRSGVRFPTAYGPGSAVAHQRLALARGASVRTIERVGFRHDVDTWEDLVALRDVEVGRHTAEVLPRLVGRLAG